MHAQAGLRPPLVFEGTVRAVRMGALQTLQGPQAIPDLVAGQDRLAGGARGPAAQGAQRQETKDQIMLRVTIELLPHGSESRTRLLGTAYIVNDGFGSENSGNYQVTLSRRGGKEYKGEVTDFPRKRLGPWDLLFQALAVTVGSKRKP